MTPSSSPTTRPRHRATLEVRPSARSVRNPRALSTRRSPRRLRVVQGPLYLLAGLGLAAALTLTACAPSPVKTPGRAPVLPARMVPGAVHYRVVQDSTLVYARVFRGGSLARLGHNHIIEFKDLRGEIYLADPVGRSRFDLAVSPVDAVVDPPRLRASQGSDFRSTVSKDARAGTRSNMLGHDVLDAAEFPWVTISSEGIRGPLHSAEVTVKITLKGVTRRLTVPVSITVNGSRLSATGHLDILQSEFGIQPYSVLGGALKVKDEVGVVFAVAAQKVR